MEGILPEDPVSIHGEADEGVTEMGQGVQEHFTSQCNHFLYR